MALWKALKVKYIFKSNIKYFLLFQTESGYSVQFGKSFELSIFDPFFTDPFLLLKDRWRKNLGHYNDKNDMKMIPLKNNVSELFLKFLMNIIITPYTLAQTLSRTGSSTKVFWMTFTRYNSNYEPETDFIMINVYHTSAWLSSCSWQYSSSCYSSQWTGPTSLVGSSTSSSLAR